MGQAKRARIAYFLAAIVLSASGGIDMRVQFKTEGGIAYFPGLAQPVIFDSTRLSPEDAAELKRLIDRVRFFDLPRQVGIPPRGAADYYTYTVTVEEDGRSHTVQMTDFVQEPELKELLGLLKKLRAQYKP